MPSDASHNPKVHLNLAGDKPEDPRVLRVTVKQSKTDPLRKGIDLFLGKMSSDLFLGKMSSDLQQC